MEMLKVKNWEKFQHYKDRCPPWIKLHVKLLNDRKFSMLSRASKCLLVLLWVLASEKDGMVENDIDEIKFRLRDSSISETEINMLINEGFLCITNNLQADASKAYSETETETETETEGKQKKRKKFVPPSIDDVLNYAKEKGYSLEIAKKAFEHYDVADWHDTYGKKVLNWKQKINTNWFKPENAVPRTEDAV